MTEVRKGPNWASIGLAQDAFAGVRHSPAFSPDRKLTLYGGQQPVTPGSMAAERMWDLRE